jgi:hypothetical protein
VSGYDVVVVDALNAAWKWWWPHRGEADPNGCPQGLERGFLEGLLGLTRTHAPARVVLVWDGAPARGRALDSTYKPDSGFSPGPAEEPRWPERIRGLREALAGIYPTLYDPASEADELIARYVAGEAARPSRCLIVSEDHDFDQLLGPLVDRLAGQRALRDEAWVRTYWGVDPPQVPLVRAVLGDVSDGIPAVGAKVRKTTLERLARDSWGVTSFLAGVLVDPDLTLREREALLGRAQAIFRNYALMVLSQEPSVVPAMPPGDPTGLRDLCVRDWIGGSA